VTKLTMQADGLQIWPLHPTHLWSKSLTA